MPLNSGQILNNRYRIVKLLGEGGFGAVYRAWDMNLNGPCAVKENNETSPDAARQFAREASLLFNLHHPNLPRVTDHFTVPGQGQYLVMDFVEGEDMQAMLTRAGGALPEEQVLAWVAQICDALAYMHAQNPPIIHRDIKPGNIKITPDGRAVLVDFGIAKAYDPNLATTQGARAVTPGFSPPEQYGEGKTDARSDVYALGATLYTLLTGQIPASSVDIIAGTSPLPKPVTVVNPQVTAKVSDAITRAMNPGRTGRFGSVSELRAALGLPTAPLARPASAPIMATVAATESASSLSSATLLATEPPPARPFSAEPPSKPEKRRSRGWIWAAAGGVALLVVCGALVGGFFALRPLIFPVATEAPTAVMLVPTQPPAKPTNPPPAPTDVPAPTDAPTAVPQAAIVKVGLVTDTGGINDRSFNQSAWMGVQKAAKEFGFEARYIESKQPTDYEKNIDQFATEGYDVIITVGFFMGDATAIKARQYPDIHFAVVDNAYFPTTGYAACPDTVKDCYDDGGLSNVTSLMFQEDEVGFLAGVLAAGMTKTDVICSVSGIEIPPVARFVTGYQNGAKWFRPGIQTLNVYIPSFTDPAKGKEVAISMIGQNCDVIFGVGGNTGNGGLLAAKEKGLMAIGVDVDQYLTYPEVGSALISSAMKNVDTAVYEYLKMASLGKTKSGIITANLRNRGVGLAPFHDWEGQVPPSVLGKIKEAIDGLINGTISTGYKP